MSSGARWLQVAWGATFLSAISLLSSVAQAVPLTAQQRTERSAAIRDVAADNGIATGYLFAGIAEAETALSHCWSELEWACQGPASIDCGGGPVVAGAGDGPCNLQQGGLGMFQFDGGTFSETIERDGDGVLLLSGNVTRAIDFVVNMVINSQYVDVSNQAEAKAWLNQVEVGGEHWDAWIKTVTHYYNGCSPASCGVYAQRYAHYDSNGRDVYEEQGASFWDVTLGVCSPIGSEPHILEETDPCFTKGGPLSFWRVGIGGESNLHVWTSTIDSDESVNFVQWSLSFAETGEYRVEVNAPAATSTAARYIIEHAGMTEEVIVDQSQAAEFVELGTFVFDTEGGQRILLGDNTGEASNEKLVADAIRVTRLDVPGISSGATTGTGSGTGSGGSGGEGGSGSDGDPRDDDGGCSIANKPAHGGSSGWLFGLLVAAALGSARRRQRRAR